MHIYFSRVGPPYKPSTKDQFLATAVQFLLQPIVLRLFQTDVEFSPMLKLQLKKLFNAKNSSRS